MRDLPGKQTPYCLRLCNQNQNHQHTSHMAEPSVQRTRFKYRKRKCYSRKTMATRSCSCNSCNYFQKYPTTKSQSVKLLTDDDSENYHILTKVASTALIYYPNKTSCSVWRHESLVNLIILTRSWIFLSFIGWSLVDLGVSSGSPLSDPESLPSLQPIRSTHD